MMIWGFNESIGWWSWWQWYGNLYSGISLPNILPSTIAHSSLILVLSFPVYHWRKWYLGIYLARVTELVNSRFRSGSLPPEPVLFVCSCVCRACVFWPIRHRQRDKWQPTFFSSRTCFTHMLSFHSILTSQRRVLWLAAFYRWGYWCSESLQTCPDPQLVNSRVGIYSRASRLLCLLTRKWKNLQELKANFCFKSLCVAF